MAGVRLKYKLLPYNKCNKCKNKSSPKEGFYWGENGDTLIHCECHLQWKDLNLQRIKISKAGLSASEDDLSYDIDNDYMPKGSNPKCVQQFKSIVDKFKLDTPLSRGLVLVQGQTCTQKTTQAMWMARKLIGKGFSLRYFTLPAFLDQIVPATFNAEAIASANQSKEALYEVDCLIIDSFMANLGSIVPAFQIPHLEYFIQERLTRFKKFTMLITQEPPALKKGSAHTASFIEWLNFQVSLHSSLIECTDSLNKLNITKDALF